MCFPLYFPPLQSSSHVDMVLLQHPPSSKGFLPSFHGFKSFAPSIAGPRVACHVSLSFLQRFAVLPSFSSESDDFMALDVYTPKGCLGLKFPRFRIGNSYARPLPPAPHSVSPETALPVFDFPYLVAGYFNLHKVASDPSRLLSAKEEKESASYFNRATDLGYTLLNTPGIYTRSPFTGTHRPSTIDLAFANPEIFSAFGSWDISTQPSAGSDHPLILISLRPPCPHKDKPRPCWQEVDWPSLTDKLKDWQVPLPPDAPSPNQLDQWFSLALSTLTTTIEATAPHSRPSPRSKALWSLLLTSLRKDFMRATRRAKELQTPDSYTIARQSKLGYFKSIKRAKASYRADFLAKASPNNIWTAKQLVAPRKTPRFPSLPDASGRWQLTRRHCTISSLPKTPCPAGAVSKETPQPPLSYLRKSNSPFPNPPPPRPLALTGFLTQYGRRSTSSTPQSSLSSSPPWWHSATTPPH